jgi:Herelleviridae head maturation protease
MLTTTAHTAPTFHLELPVETFYKAGAKPGQERRIGGFITSEHRDRSHEVVLQRGLDLSEFLQHGWFNDNHSKKTTDVVGFPDFVELRQVAGKPGYYVEGYLLTGHKPADEIWDLAQVLQKTNRRLGFSIEGGIQERLGPAGEIIAKAKVREVAITKCPVNTHTGLEILAKSFAAFEEQVRRGLMAGSAVSNPGPQPGSGFALRTESMEREPKKRKRRLTRDEALSKVLERWPALSKAAASRFLHLTARRAA